MKKISIVFIFLVLIFGIILTGCQSALFNVAVASDPFVSMKKSVSDCSYGGEIKSIEAVDRHTVRFELCYPDPAFAAKIAFPVFVIQDRAFLNFTEGNSEILSKSANGTGPYYLKRYIEGQSIVLARNDEYWGVPPKMAEIEFYWSSDSSFRQNEILSGNVDGIDIIEKESHLAFLSDNSVEVYTLPSLNVLLVGMNNNVPPFNNVIVRKAVGYAIDRQRITESFFPPGSTSAEQLVPPVLAEGNTPGLRWFDPDHLVAVDLLDQVEFDFSQDIPLYYVDQSSDFLSHSEEVAQEIRKDLLQVGVHIRPEPVSITELEKLILDEKAGIFLKGISADYPDALSFYNNLFTGNIPYLGEPYQVIVETVQNASTTDDERERQRLFDQINEEIKSEVPIVPIVHASSGLVFRSNIQNVLIGPMNENFPEMVNDRERIIFLQSDEPASLWPADETGMSTFRITSLLYDTLTRYDYGETTIVPGLAEHWESNAAFTEWTFSLRYGVKFRNGAELDANDVVASFSALWDGNDPNHRGNSGNFEYFKKIFGDFLIIEQ